ncbi:MAG: hypothetical protein ISS47_01510 [Candidatus Omnitrophica bacterium]|nr:hypothetical protein [Candidatus Omnitrophota bacterium]
MKNIFTFKKVVLGSILLCIAYWIYLIIFSQMSILCDAGSYENLGSIIYKGGWIEYFKTGPHREPLYPLIISVSMKIANVFSVPYYYIQKIIQVIILLGTQLLAILLLEKLQINRVLRVFAILYIGFSPALVNSAFSLFSEVATLPFVMGIILMSIFLWRNVQKMSYIRIVFWGLIFALLFLGATFAKGIFRHVFMIFLIPYVFMIFRFLKAKDRKSFMRIGVYIIVVLVVFNGLFFYYKFLNLKYNGNFEFTDRYGSLLYGNAAKRAEKLTFRMLLAHIVYIPGEGVAHKFFTPQEVEYCGFKRADYLRGHVKGLTNQESIALAWQKFLERPFQYILFMGIESTHIFFWESTQIGFVEYPVGLQRLFDFIPFKNSLRLIMSLLTIIAFIWMVVKVLKMRRMLFDTESHESELYQIKFFMVLLVVSHAILYSFFSILTRYVLPLAPLYVISIACFLDRNKARYTKC